MGATRSAVVLSPAAVARGALGLGLVPAACVLRFGFALVTPMERDAALREHVRKLLDWEDAHVNFDTAVKGIPSAMRGAVPEGLPHSLWQLVEHLRRAQHDILDFCRNPSYEELTFPDDYWPASAAPPDGAAWDRSLAGFRRDLGELEALAANPAVDLFDRIPHGSGQTYLRELLLVADHNTYHVGQVVAVRQRLGIWPGR